MNSITNKLIRKNATILERMITEKTPYEEIVKQSQKLDKYILIAMKQINSKIGVS